ncbi:MAG TPA: hypothetical protein VHM65_11335, partial [Candidatus Lustribacter sp.]|nr:hypothetical protein [Candidatus Lustribacter sp.]
PVSGQHRCLALVVAGIALTLLGLLAILSIGLPIVAAGIAPEDASGGPHGRNRPVELAKRLAIPA